MHFRVALALLILRRTGRVNDRGIDDSALTQHQSTVAQVAIDDAQNTSHQVVLFQQAAEVEDGGFIRDTIQVDTSKLAQNRGFVERHSVAGSL